MALDSKNNIKSVFIMPPIATAPAAGTKVTPGSTNGGVAGWVGITNMSNEVLQAGTNPTLGVQSYDKIKIIKDRGANNPLQQVVLSLSELANTSAYAGSIATEQVSYIGNNGTAGTINGISAITNNFFIVKLEHTPNSFIYGKRPASYKYGTYQSTGSDTQNTVCENLVKSLITNFRANRSTDWRVRSEVVCNAALNATPGIINITLTKYSRTAICSGGSMAALTPGVAIRICDAGVNTLDTQTPVYVITAVSGTTITLNYAYQGPSGVTLNADCDIVTNYGTSGCGIKITGLKQKYDVNRWRQYDKVRFGVYLEGFTGTPVETTGAFDGVAVYEQAANDEYISWGDEGQVFVDQVPPLFREQDAVVGQQYNPVVVSWLSRLNSLIGAGENKGQVIIYMAGTPDGIGEFAPTDNQATFRTVFNSWAPTNLDLPTGNFPSSTV
jgi:hypothetical protein